MLFPARDHEEVEIHTHLYLSIAILPDPVQNVELNTRAESSGGRSSNMWHEHFARPNSFDRVDLEIEEYDCGCRIRFRLVDYGEAGDELPRKPLVVPDYTPCSKHRNNQDIPPRDARLTTLRREHESFLNE